MNKIGRHKSFYCIIAIAGLVLFLLQIGVYRRTIIPFKIPFLVTLSVSVVAFFIIQHDYRTTYQNKNFFFPFAQSLISFGFIACYLLMAANYYFADNNFERKSVSILKKYTIGSYSKSQPAIEIYYDGIEKELVFYRSQQQQVDKAELVLLSVKKGFFGFDIFSEVELQ